VASRSRPPSPLPSLALVLPRSLCLWDELRSAAHRPVRVMVVAVRRRCSRCECHPALLGGRPPDTTKKRDATRKGGVKTNLLASSLSVATRDGGTQSQRTRIPFLAIRFRRRLAAFFGRSGRLALVSARHFCPPPRVGVSLSGSPPPRHQPPRHPFCAFVRAAAAPRRRPQVSWPVSGGRPELSTAPVAPKKKKKRMRSRRRGHSPLSGRYGSAVTMQRGQTSK